MAKRSARIRVNGWSRSAARIGGALGFLLLGGCAGIESAPQPEATPVAAPSTVSVSIEPKVAPPASLPVAEVAPAASPPEQPPAMGMVREPVAAEPMVPPAAPTVSAATEQRAARPDASTPKAPAKVPPAPSPGAQLPKKETPAPALARPEPPPLDLKALETRLKDTKAIGVFTKLTLKNQVDDLLEQFRAFYQGRLKTSLADLRRSYDLLVLKVLALLQDADPPLASAIAASRESIWGILSNPAKFAAI